MRAQSLGWLIASTPALLLCTALAHAAHLWMILGRRPIPILDNPQGAIFDAHDWLIQILIWAAMIAPVLWIAFLALARFAIPKSLAAKQLATLLGGYAALLLFFTFDPTGYVAWFAD